MGNEQFRRLMPNCGCRKEMFAAGLPDKEKVSQVLTERGAHRLDQDLQHFQLRMKEHKQLS